MWAAGAVWERGWTATERPIYATIRNADGEAFWNDRGGTPPVDGARSLLIRRRLHVEEKPRVYFGI
jgi:hypothetical protein